MLPDDPGHRSPVDPFAELVATDPELRSLTGLGRGLPDRSVAGLTPLVLVTVGSWWLALGPAGGVLATVLCATALVATAWGLADTERNGPPLARGASSAGLRRGPAARRLAPVVSVLSSFHGPWSSEPAHAAGAGAVHGPLLTPAQARRRVVNRARLTLACAVLLAAVQALLVGPGSAGDTGPDVAPVTVLVAEPGTEPLRVPVEEALGSADDRGARWAAAARSGTPLTAQVGVTGPARAGWFPVTVSGEAACVRITVGAERVSPTCPEAAAKLSAASR